MKTSELNAITAACNGSVRLRAGRVTIEDRDAMTRDLLPLLTEGARSSHEDTRRFSRWLVWSLGQTAGCGPASAKGLLGAMARRDQDVRLVPAVVCESLSTSRARGILETSHDLEVGPMVLGMKATADTTEEDLHGFFAATTCAALAEHRRLPVILGLFDHCGGGPSGHFEALVPSAVEAGFLNFFCCAHDPSSVATTAARHCPTWIEPYAGLSDAPITVLDLDETAPERTIEELRKLVRACAMVDSVPLLKLHTIPAPFKKSPPIQV